MPTPIPRETMSWEVDARPDTSREVEVAFVLVALTITRFVMVDVALFARMPPVKVCNALQLLALARLRDATTVPVVGLMVSVLSELDTELTAPPDPPTHVPLTAKHPVVTLIPFANVDVPVPCILMIPVVCIFPVVVVEIPMPRPLLTIIFDDDAVEVIVKLVVVAPTKERLLPDSPVTCN